MAPLTADQIFEKIGSFGKYQLVVLIVANALEWFWGGWPILLMTFIAAEPGWRCVGNSSECSLTGSFKPGDDDYDRRCEMSRNAWEFVDDFTSVVTEFDLVCGKAIQGTISSSMIFLGWIISAFVGGILADKFGRKPFVFGFGFIVAVFSLLSAFPPVFWLFALFRFIVGLGLGGFGMALFVLVAELVGVRHRSMMGASVWYGWTLSLIALSGVAYLVRDWKMLCIATGVPAIPLVLFWFVSPSSLRWLIVKGKMLQATFLYKRIARVNGKELPKEGFEIASGGDSEYQRLGDLRDLFRTRTLTKTTLISYFLWFVNSLVYYGVFLSSPAIGGNMYLNFFLSSVVELPAVPVGILIYNRFGRKKGVIIPMLLAAAGAVGAVLLTTYDDESNKGYLAGRIILGMVWAKFWITISFDGLFIYSSELFPTVVRNAGMGSSTCSARIGSFLSPYIVFLQRVHVLLPYGIFAVLSLVAALLCLLLPETRFRPTLENINEEFTESSNVTEEKGDVEKKALVPSSVTFESTV